MSEVILRANQITKVDSVVSDSITISFEPSTVGSEYKLIFTTDTSSKISINFLAKVKWIMGIEDLIIENDKIYEFDFVNYHGIILGSFNKYNNQYAIEGTYEGCTTSNIQKLVDTNSTYQSVITANEGYTLEGASVTITMSGKNITDVSYTDGIITIDKVTSDVIISITAKPKELITDEDNTGTTENGTDNSNDTSSENTDIGSGEESESSPVTPSPDNAQESGVTNETDSETISDIEGGV